MRFWIGRIGTVFCDGFVDAADIILAVYQCAGPDLGRLDSLELEAGNDAEVRRATLESPEEVLVLLCGGSDDAAGGCDDFVADDCVGAEADLVPVEVDAAGEEEACNTDGGEAAACNCEGVGGEVGVDGAPFVAWPEGQYRFVGVERDLCQVGQDDEHPWCVDAVCALVNNLARA